ncbi:MAG: hypothetical protein ABSA26_07135 [Thermoguttaceae bacterium]|jgi:broad specificity phosphatase PhoE
MKKNKSFDCVQMKYELQARMAKKYEGLTDEEIARRRREWLEKSDDPLAKWWRSIPSPQTSSSKGFDAVKTQ